MVFGLFRRNKGVKEEREDIGRNDLDGERLQNSLEKMKLDPLKNKSNVILYREDKLYGRVSTPKGKFTFYSERIPSNPERNWPRWTIYGNDGNGYDIKIGSVWLKKTKYDDPYLFVQMQIDEWNKNYCAFDSRQNNGTYNMDEWRKSRTSS